MAIPSSYRFRDSAGNMQEAPFGPDALAGGGNAANGDRDTNGDPVPTYRPHNYTYDTSGNPLTDTVSDDTNTWVRTFTYTNGALATDSGWVKQ